MERAVRFEPGYDKRNADPAKNYGIHGVQVRFLLAGPEGVVQFLIYTDWLPESAREGKARLAHLFPMGADLGYHSPKPLHEWHEPDDSRECEFLPTHGRCWYDGSGLNAEPVLERLINEGDGGVWAALEDYYALTFKPVAKGEVSAGPYPRAEVEQ